MRAQPRFAAREPYSCGTDSGRGRIAALPNRNAADAGNGMNRVTIARAGAQTTRAIWARGRCDSKRAFRAARRHSRVVRVLRVALPAAAAVGLLAATLVTYLNPLRVVSELPIGNLVVSGSKVTMEQPRLAGFTHDARAYELNADAAQQDLAKPNLIELHNIRATVQMQDKSTLRVTARRGLYNSKSETLDLNNQINLASSGGYRARLSEAKVDIGRGHVVSEHPVKLDMLQGRLDAKQMEIVDSGDLVRFTNGVRMTMRLDENSTGTPAGAQADQSGKAGASASARSDGVR